MSRAIITPATAPLRGTLLLPGDKSISHRRALMSLFVKDEVRLENYGSGDDCRSTLRCLERLGKTVVRSGNDVVISGEISTDSADLDCGNSGTTARLLMGILAARKGNWTLHGDASLSRRPMERVAEPLRLMGARIELTSGSLPAKIRGRRLHGIAYDSPVSSAQVKSAVLLAGLEAVWEVCYREPVQTRDHTEKILGIEPISDRWIVLDPRTTRLSADRVSASIPSDPSAAAFWIAASLMVRGSRLEFPIMLVNPQRIAFVELLRASGADLSLHNVRTVDREETGSLNVSFSLLRTFSICDAATAQVIDEIPLLAIAATKCRYAVEFGGLGELRVKESDRLRLTTENLRRMGANVHVWDDGFSVEGETKLSGVEIETDGDHRIAMAFAVAGLSAQGETVIDNAECVSVSYPEFWDHFRMLAPHSIQLVS